MQEENKKATGKTPIGQSITKAVDILQCFTREHSEHTLVSLSRRLGIPKATVHRILVTLKEKGLIAYDAATQKYRLGMAFLEFSSLVLEQMDFRTVIRPELQKLSDRLNVNIYLSTLSGNNIVYLDELQAHRYVVISSKLGSITPAYCSAMGKAMLAGLTRKQFEQTLGDIPLLRRTIKTITDHEELWENIKKASAQGYAFEEGEYEDGLSCLAAPVRNYNGDIIAAFSISAPSTYFGTDTYSEILQEVCETSERINALLGYRSRSSLGTNSE